MLFVVPVGKPRIAFNAHRVYSYSQVVDMFPGLHLQEFALIPDTPDEGLIRHSSGDSVEGLSYGCGCFWLMKPEE